MFTPPNRHYIATGECDGYNVQTAPAIGGCTQWDKRGQEAIYKTKKTAFKALFKTTND